MENLQVFKNSEFGELGVLLIDGKEYFPATACAKTLGYANPREAIKRHCKGCVVKRDAWVQTGIKADGTPAMRKNEISYISEGNLYRLIVNSKLPAAERFERWVFEEVLPALRKQGVYISNENQFTQKLIADTVAETVKQLLPLFAGMQQATHPHEIEPTPRRRRKSNYSRANYEGIVERIDPELRKVVDEMLGMPETYSYVDIAKYLNENGIQISGTSVQRYYFRMLARAQPGLTNQIVPIIIQMPEK